jgi:gluconolactonase
MNKFFESTFKISFYLVFLTFTKPALCQISDSSLLTLSSSGWTITADLKLEQLTLYHNSLGVVLKEITLHARNKDDAGALKVWNAEKKGENLLVLRTESPASAWTFELNHNNIIISATTADMFISSRAPASVERVVARLLDPAGVPVNWRGTNEIENSWNGKDTQNPSTLPAKNSEVMTFALGQVAASNLHSLFDRKKNIAVSFSEMTLMTRDVQDQDILDIMIPVPGRSIIRLIPEYYTKALGLPVYSRFDDAVFPSAPLIWGSWTAYYYEVRESDIVSNTDWLAENLKPYGFQYVQLDDGYDRGKDEGHYWIENWNKKLFPHGPEWLANYIKSKGMHPGLWIVPNSYAGFFKQHPDWYLYDKSGNVITDYRTQALDYTNPDVQEWLRKLFTTLKGWGFEYFKFDGEFSLPMYVPDIDRGRIYDKSIDPLTAYHDRLKLIRGVIGPETFIEGCVAGTPLNGIGYFNSCFNGADMYNSWKGSYAVFSSINANAFLNHMVMYVMPGEGIDVSPLMSVEEAKQKMAPRAIEVALTREDPFTGFGTTLPEARTLVSIVSLTGVAYPLTSIMTRLPEERVDLLKKTMPTLPIIPIDLFSRGTDITWDKFKYTTPDSYIHDYPEIIDLKVNAISGVYDVTALTNWRGEKISKSISFSEKLGLEESTPYIVFDFWNQKLLGVYSDIMEIDIEPHDTRVLLIHPLQSRPQLIGNSRHISGVHSILDLKWDNSNNILSGTSETVQGDIYSIFIYVPDGMTLSEAKATSISDNELKAKSELAGNMMKVSFQGQKDKIRWRVKFSDRQECAFVRTGSVERLDPLLDNIIAPGELPEIIASGFEWAEGPVWLTKQKILLFSDIPVNSVYQWSEKDGLKLYLKPAGYTDTTSRGGEVGSNGLLVDRVERLVLCQHGDRRIARMDARLDNPEPRFVTLADKWQGKRFNSPNDAVYNSRGDLFFTDPPYGMEKGFEDPKREINFTGVYKLSAEGELTLLTDKMTAPNGIGFSPDESRLYVANSGEGDNCIWMEYSFRKGRSLEDGRIFANASLEAKTNPGAPDGLKVRKDGMIFATGPGGVWIFSPEGKHLGTVKTGQATSNCAFGDEGKYLYITADMYLMRIRLK